MTTADAPERTEDAAAVETLSKNQRKRLEKLKRYEETREERRVYKKEKQKALKLKRKAVVEEALEKGLPLPAKRAKIEAAEQESSGIGVIIDMDFMDLMADRVTFCYSKNKSSSKFVDLHVTSMTPGKAKENMLRMCPSYGSWRESFIKFHEEHYLSVPMASTDSNEVKKDSSDSNEVKEDASDSKETQKDEVEGHESVEKNDAAQEAKGCGNSEKENDPQEKEASLPETACGAKAPLWDRSSIVYLTGDSPNTLDTLSPGTMYVIGGLVDRNRHKSVCYNRAVEAGVRHARLPIRENVEMKSRDILTVNQVFEIMLKYIETEKWTEALKVIPERKERKILDEKDGSSVDAESEPVAPAPSEAL